MGQAIILMSESLLALSYLFEVEFIVPLQDHRYAEQVSRLINLDA
jgi:hypothetical protein